MIQYDLETGAFVCRVVESNYQMQFHTNIELPSEPIDDKSYYSLRDINDNVPIYSDDSCRWVVKQYQVSVIAYKKQTKKQQLFDDESLVTDDYTLLKPATQYDEWIDGEWVINEQAQYEAQIQKVESTRRALYTNVDALRNEAAMIRFTEGDEAKALDYEQQAKDLYLKIRDENPWPISPSE